MFLNDPCFSEGFMDRRENLKEIFNFLDCASEKTTLSQMLLPYPTNSSESEPVALLIGNINARKSLKKDGEAVDLENELEVIKTELSFQKPVGTVIDLSAEMKNLQIDASGTVSEKEVEIKEEWTEADELLAQSRIQRHAITLNSDNSNKKVEPKSKLPDDIEELLKLAEMEEQHNDSNIIPEKSKIKAVKSEMLSGSKKSELLKKEFSESNVRLPKINATNPLVGEIVERESHTPLISTQLKADPVSSRIIANELRTLGLKNSSNEEYELERQPAVEEISSKSLKKSSLFSRRNQGQE